MMMPAIWVAGARAAGFIIRVAAASSMAHIKVFAISAWANNPSFVVLYCFAYRRIDSRANSIFKNIAKRNFRVPNA